LGLQRCQLRILVFVNVQLALQGWWLRFLVLLPAYAVFFGVVTHFMPGHSTESIGSSVISGLIFGVIMAGVTAYQGEAMHKAAVEAVAGLDKTKRSQAVAAVTDGVVPVDMAVRYAAVRLGLACLGGKTVDELKRRERRAWITGAIIVALVIVWAMMQSSAYATLYFLALALIVAITLPCAILRGRRFQRNCALLTERLPSP
jgi:hypothetical protein